MYNFGVHFLCFGVLVRCFGLLEKPLATNGIQNQHFHQEVQFCLDRTSMQQNPQKSRISKYSVLSRQNAVPDVKKDPYRQKVSPRFDIILGSLRSPDAVKDRIDFLVVFGMLLWELFGTIGRPKDSQKCANDSHCRPCWMDRCKCENYAPVQAGASLLGLEGAPGDLLCTTLATLF